MNPLNYVSAPKAILCIAPALYFGMRTGSVWYGLIVLGITAAILHYGPAKTTSVKNRQDMR